MCHWHLKFHIAITWIMMMTMMMLGSGECVTRGRHWSIDKLIFSDLNEKNLPLTVLSCATIWIWMNLNHNRHQFKSKVLQQKMFDVLKRRKHNNPIFVPIRIVYILLSQTYVPTTETWKKSAESNGKKTSKIQTCIGCVCVHVCEIVHNKYK